MDDATLLKSIELVLDNTLGEAAQKRQFETQLSEELRTIRDAAFRAVIDQEKLRRSRGAQKAQEAVALYCSACVAKSKKALVMDARVPDVINYLERYNEFRGIQDRGILLTRIAQTIDLADKVCSTEFGTGVQDAFKEVANLFKAYIAIVGSIGVGAPSSGKHQGEKTLMRGNSEAAVSSSVEDVASEAFAETLNDVEASDLLDTPQAMKAELENRLRRASSAAQVRLDELAFCDAASIEGESLDVSSLPSFDGEITCTCVFDRHELQELLNEVLASFKTYSAVVRDNGVFAAFSDGSDFGNCVGLTSWWSAWDDWSAEAYGFDNSEYQGDIPGMRHVDGIASTVEEDEPRGDSLERSIERMREFNRRRYMGIFDDGFKHHVDTFWYGFRKLMEYVNGMYAIDASAFHDYCSLLRKPIESRAFALGMKMDSVQLEDYLEKVSNLTKDLEVAHG